MKKCPNCDADIDNGRTVCPFCGSTIGIDDSVNDKQYKQDTIYTKNTQQQYQSHQVNDTGSVGYWLIGFFVPLIGIILYFVWRYEQPNNAKRCLWGAVVSIIVSFVLTILTFICMIIAALSGGI